MQSTCQAAEYFGDARLLSLCDELTCDCFVTQNTCSNYSTSHVHHIIFWLLIFLLYKNSLQLYCWLIGVFATMSCSKLTCPQLMRRNRWVILKELHVLHWLRILSLLYVIKHALVHYLESCMMVHVEGDEWWSRNLTWRSCPVSKLVLTLVIDRDQTNYADHISEAEHAAMIVV